jgi:hypothetical protein
MLNQISTNPLAYFCLASGVFALALLLAPADSVLKKRLRLALNQTGKAKMFVPLFTSLGISFALTVILKLIN